MIIHILTVIGKFCGLNCSKETIEKAAQFILFCLVGGSSAVVMYLSYALLFLWTNNYYVANFFGFFTSVTNSFYWNNRIVFKGVVEKRKLLTVYLKTILLYSATGLILSNLLLYIWIEYLHISEMIAPLINAILMVPINFILNKIWAFN